MVVSSNPPTTEQLLVQSESARLPHLVLLRRAVNALELKEKSTVAKPPSVGDHLFSSLHEKYSEMH